MPFDDDDEEAPLSSNPEALTRSGSQLAARMEKRERQARETGKALQRAKLETLKQKVVQQSSDPTKEAKDDRVATEQQREQQGSISSGQQEAYPDATKFAEQAQAQAEKEQQALGQDPEQQTQALG